MALEEAYTQLWAIIWDVNDDNPYSYILPWYLPLIEPLFPPEGVVKAN